LFALACEIDTRLRQRATTRRRNYALDAFDLAECKRLELFRHLGYSSITAYAHAVNGFGSSKTSDLIRIAEAAERLPKTKKAFLAGKLEWCAAREIVKKATPENEAEWLEKSDRLTVQELKAEVEEKDPVYRRLLELSSEELAWVEAVADGIRREGGPFALGKAIAEACRRILEGDMGSLGGPGYRIVIYRCGDCGEAIRETSEGPVSLSPEDVELAYCDAELLDVRNGPQRISRTVPPKIKNYVMARDKGRCVVPGCRNRAIHFHHEDGRQNGHDPSRCFGLCGSHHRGRHKGYLRTEGSMPDLHFYRRDGTYLGRAGDERRATDLDFTEAEPTHQDGSAPVFAPAASKASPAARSDAAAEASAHAEVPPVRASSAAAEVSAHAEAPPVRASSPAAQAFAHAEAPPVRASSAAAGASAHAEAPPVRASSPAAQASAHAEAPPVGVFSAAAEASAHAEAPLGTAPALTSRLPLPGEPATNPVHDATLGLRALGLKAREVEACVQRALRLYPGRSWEAGDLARAALQCLPTPG
jgi:hypothetical protein